jgi:hypothetical protein
VRSRHHLAHNCTCPWYQLHTRLHAGPHRSIQAGTWRGPSDKDLLACFAEGWGEFVDPHTVKVSLTAGGEKTVTAHSILIATGGRAVRAPIEGSVCNLSPAAPLTSTRPATIPPSDHPTIPLSPATLYCTDINCVPRLSQLVRPPNNTEAFAFAETDTEAVDIV